MKYVNNFSFELSKQDSSVQRFYFNLIENTILLFIIVITLMYGYRIFSIIAKVWLNAWITNSSLIYLFKSIFYYVQGFKSL